MTATTRRRHWRNFDAVRLFAATAVVLSHCFLLSAQGYASEPLVRLLGPDHDLGRLAVGAFFVISGFLITRSFVGRASTTSYLLSRVMRIFPGLIVCTLVTAFLIGPAFAPSVSTYLSGHELWSYLWRTSLMQPGGGTGFPVSLYTGPQGAVMLGTTWSLPCEFECYLLVMLLGALGMLRWPAAILLLAAGVWAHTNWSFPFLEATAWTMMFFAAGVVLHFVHAWRRPTTAVGWGAAAGLLVCAVAGVPFQGFALFGSVLLIQLATSERLVLPDLGRHGDLSYGVYLYGWPIQQVVRALWGPSIDAWQMFAITMPVALGCAWLSWRLVESRALAFGQRFRQAAAAGPPLGTAPAAAPA